MTKPYNYDYQSAGFNAFFRRSIGSPFANTSLSDLQSKPTMNELHFDDQQVSGALGDLLRIGLITLNGKIGRISIADLQNNEPVRIGDLDS